MFDRKIEEKKEFERILSIEGEALRLGLTNNYKWERYFTSRGMPVADTTIDRWFRQRNHLKLTKKQRKAEEELDIRFILSKEKKKIIDSLLKSVADGKVQGITTALQVLGELTKDKVVEKEDLTPEEYSEAGRRIIDRFRDNYKQSGGICPVCQRPSILPD